MKFLTNILAKFKGKPKAASDIWKDNEGVINFAFSAGGKDYYCFDDLINKPYKRALAAIDFYRELSMNVDKEYLKLHYAKAKEILSGKAINIQDIIKLTQINEFLGERLFKLGPSPDLIYKLASVVYFDKSENPTNYDFKFNQEKIKGWKKEFPDGSFFLQKPIKTLVPFLNESQESLNTYLQVWAGIESLHLESLSLQQSEAKDLKESSNTAQ